MARVHVLCDDLLFGSRLEAQLTGAGHTVLLGGIAAEPGPFDAQIVDLTADAGARLRQSAALPRIAFYSHVDGATREAALAAGIEIVVPRSRIAREAPALLARLLATAR